ncbi:TPA: Ig-like domain repeat protein, partial [Candidatus Micrarchaeota archaeon]|nr:Ig-like domain repeat protein [Candidatus Micrarchaeota archaeon]
MSCTCAGGTTNVCNVGDVNAGEGMWVDFNIFAGTTAVSGDYNVDVDVEYVNPANKHKFWAHQQRKMIEVRKKGILEIILSEGATDVVRGEENAVFISKTRNTGTVDDENAWIAYTYPSEWTVVEKNSDGVLIGGATDVNAFKQNVPPDSNIELNVVFGIPADAPLGSQLVRIETGTATDPTWGDHKNVYVNVWDRPELNLLAGDCNASVGEEITLTARLRYSDGNAAAGQRIYFEKNGMPLGAADTNADGDATYIWDLSAENAGTYAVTARYDGNAEIYLLPAESNIVVNVGLPPEINASVDDANVGYGMDVEIEANVADDQGIANVWATIREADGGEYNVSLSPVAGSTYKGIFRPWKEGEHEVIVHAKDLYDSISSSDPIYVYATAEASVNVETDKNFYLQGEAVDLKASDWWDSNWR